MQTLSYGFQLPDSGDKGAALFAGLAENIQLLNDHNHDGENSALLSSAAIQAGVQSLSSADWASYGGAPVGHYRQLVTCAAGFLFDTSIISVRTPAGALVTPTIERVTNTTFYIYTTDNTIGFNLVYGS
jgi:hypothetical protein